MMSAPRVIQATDMPVRPSRYMPAASPAAMMPATIQRCSKRPEM